VSAKEKIPKVGEFVEVPWGDNATRRVKVELIYADEYSPGLFWLIVLNPDYDGKGNSDPFLQTPYGEPRLSDSSAISAKGVRH
jgi:hypothetical protein